MYDRRTIRRRRRVALLVVVSVVALVVTALTGAGARPRTGTASVERARRVVQSAHRPGTRTASTHPGRPAHPRAARPPSAARRYGVGIIWMRFTDTSRSVTLANGTTAPRALLTAVRYPAASGAPAVERRGAAPARGPFPLIVFGHGFDVSPGIYSQLLDAWTAAGYVVAAPAFPLSNPSAPGGPDERDLPNQPGDMSYVITRMLAAGAAPQPPLHGLIERHEIAVAGQSDGGDTALAVADDPRVRDPRVSAVAVLSGAYDPFISSFTFGSGGPPLLATQGTADPINLPSATAAFYEAAPAPKYLLQLPGAGHLPPYTNGQPQLGVVERVTTAFFDEYLKHEPGAAERMERAGSVPGIATFSADP